MVTCGKARPEGIEPPTSRVPRGCLQASVGEGFTPGQTLIDVGVHAKTAT